VSLKLLDIIENTALKDMISK